MDRTRARAELRLIETPSETQARPEPSAFASTPQSLSQPSLTPSGAPVAKVKITTVLPVAAHLVRGGQRVKLGFHEPTMTVEGAYKTTANGRECLRLTLTCPAERVEVYVGVDHTVWVVTREQIVDDQ